MAGCSSDSEGAGGEDGMGTPLQAALWFRDHGGDLAAAADILRDLARPGGACRIPEIPWM